MRLFVLAALAVLVLAAAASADDVVVPLTVRPGPLALTPSTTLVHSTRVTVTVTDARGRGQGWTLLARMAGPFGRSVVVTGADVRCAPRSTCTLPRSTTRYPVALAAFRALPVFDAQHGSGMGAVVVTLRLGLQSRLDAPLRFTLQPS